MTRHIGRHRDTDQQVVVSLMLIPETDPSIPPHALVTYVDQLPETLRREVVQAVGSIESQRSDSLDTVLGRKLYADSGKSILQVLHEARKLHRVSIDEILMTPDGNHKLPLRTVLEAIQKIPAPDAAARFNPHTYNTVAEGQQEQIGVARNLLEEAKMLEADANYKRHQAYQLAPSLNPANKTVHAPVSTPSGGPVPAAEVLNPEQQVVQTPDVE